MKETKSDLGFILVVKEKITNGIVVDIKIGYSTMVIISNKNNYYNISIGNSEFQFKDSSNKIDVHDINSKLCLAKLFKNKITSIEIDDGTLTIEFEDTKKIITMPGHNYEAWEINGPDNFQAVCMPGGNLSYWMNT